MIGRPTRAGPKNMSCSMTRLVQSVDLQEIFDEHTVPRAWRIHTAFLEHDVGMLARIATDSIMRKSQKGPASIQRSLVDGGRGGRCRAVCAQRDSKTLEVIGANIIMNAEVRGHGQRDAAHSITTSTENRRVSGCGPTLGMT